MREAALQAQADDREQILLHHVNRAIRNRAMEYMRLIEPRFGPMLAVIDELNAPPSNSNEYREIMFKRLALEYVFEDRNYVALHPLVAASETYLSLQRPL
jgi:hypothetical protein